MPSLKELSSLSSSAEPDPSKLGLRGCTSGLRAKVARQAALLVLSLLSFPLFGMPALRMESPEQPTRSPQYTDASHRTSCFRSFCRCTQTPPSWGCWCEGLLPTKPSAKHLHSCRGAQLWL